MNNSFKADVGDDDKMRSKINEPEQDWNEQQLQG